MQALFQGREIEQLLVRLYELLVRSGLPPEATWVVDEAEAEAINPRHNRTGEVHWYAHQRVAFQSPEQNAGIPESGQRGQGKDLNVSLRMLHHAGLQDA